jgi:hypothetical protein
MPNLRLTVVSLAILLIAGCVAKAPDTPPTVASAAPYICKHEGSPPKLRTDLPPSAYTQDGQINWPKDNGFDPPKLKVVVQPGELVDRFGDACGTFLSPEGASYRGRALPYQCQGYAYTVYRVVKPLPVTIGTAAPAFGETGGAVQLQTSEQVGQLLAEGVLEKAPGAPPLSCGAH